MPMTDMGKVPSAWIDASGDDRCDRLHDLESRIGRGADSAMNRGDGESFRHG